MRCSALSFGQCGWSVDRAGGTDNPWSSGVCGWPVDLTGCAVQFKADMLLIFNNARFFNAEQTVRAHGMA